MESSTCNDKGSATGQPDASADLGWAFGEPRGACLGGARLVQRLVQSTLDISKTPEGSIPSACNGGAHQAKAAYRFFDNDNVTPEAIEVAARAPPWMATHTSAPVFRRDADTRPPGA